MSGWIAAMLAEGPLAGRRVAVDPVEGRPPKTLDLSGPDGAVYRYGLVEWTQEGHEAQYEFLYAV